MVARGDDGTTGSDTASVDLPGGTQSIQRALAVLRILATARESGLGLSEVSMHAGLTRPTTHRILGVLVAEGIVEQRQGSRRYVIGEQIPLLALSRRTRDPLLDIVSPHLRAAVGEFGDTGFFTRRVGLETVCVAREGARNLPDPGARLGCWRAPPPWCLQCRNCDPIRHAD